jgi:hypothetical protein
LRQTLPRARKKALVVRRVADEILVYDKERTRAHCLGRLAAAVWRLCDGRRTAAEIAALVRDETGAPIEETAVWVAARRLEKASLLKDRLPLSPFARTRREALKQAALLAGLSVLSITAPTSVDAATCTPNATCQNQLQLGQCTTLPCCNTGTGRCCSQGPGACACRTSGGCGA